MYSCTTCVYETATALRARKAIVGQFLHLPLFTAVLSFTVTPAKKKRPARHLPQTRSAPRVSGELPEWEAAVIIWEHAGRGTRGTSLAMLMCPCARGRALP